MVSSAVGWVGTAGLAAPEGPACLAGLVGGRSTSNLVSLGGSELLRCGSVVRFSLPGMFFQQERPLQGQRAPAR